MFVTQISMTIVPSKFASAKASSILIPAKIQGVTVTCDDIALKMMYIIESERFGRSMERFGLLGRH